MVTVAELKVAARRSLHLGMGRPATYYEDPYTDPETYAEMKVRYHSNVAPAGALGGSRNQYVEVQDRSETLIFLLEDLPRPKRNALVIFSDQEGYFLADVHAPDGITVTVNCTKAARSDLIGKYGPNGQVIR